MDMVSPRRNLPTEDTRLCLDIYHLDILVSLTQNSLSLIGRFALDAVLEICCVQVGTGIAGCWSRNGVVIASTLLSQINLYLMGIVTNDGESWSPLLISLDGLVQLAQGNPLHIIQLSNQDI